jgi:uncharacterized repeat protein (TIGR01451 family)
MFRKRFAAAVVAWGALGIVSSGFAQGPPPTSARGMFPKSTQAKTLAEQFDDFTRKLLGLPPADASEATASGSPAARAPAPRRATYNSDSPRAGSVFPLASNSAAEARSGRDSSLAGRPGYNAHGSGAGSRVPRLAGRAPAESATENRADILPGLPSFRTARTGGPSAAVKTTTEGLSGLENPMLLPLHERLQSFQRSAFDQRVAGKPSLDSAAPGNSAAVPKPADPGLTSPGVPTHRSATVPAEPAFPMGPIARPVIAQRPSPTSAPEDRPPSAVPQRSLLFARKGPVLSVETVGPRQIAVGKEATYEVTMQNRGDVGAKEAVVYISLPSWAAVVDTQVSAGAIQAAAADRGAEPFQWRIGDLPAQGRERLLLKIVPRESRPFDLAVRWDYQPVASQAMIEVQEAKLAVELAGPREVLYGQKEVYTLKVSNTGNGDAENVLIELVPMGTGGSQPVSHNLGRIQAGGQKTIEVELTARQVGDLTIKVQVRGDGGLRAELAEKVLVRRAALQVDVEGPKFQYVGGLAGYRVCVRNPGTAPAKSVHFSVSLPPGAKYLSGIGGSRLEANGTKVEWDLATLAPAGERTFILNCRLDLPGSTQIDVTSTAEGDLTASAGMTTRVEAMADLVLDVKDPSGPVPIGEEATYEVRVRNRGTKNAPNVQVVTYFSRGIEPIAAEGAQHKIEPGQVVFSPVASLAPQEELLLKVRARAEVAGNHIFRAEVHCRPLGSRLVSEETTHFYQEDSFSREGAGLAPVDEPPQDGVRGGPTPAPITAGRPTSAPSQR